MKDVTVVLIPYTRQDAIKDGFLVDVTDMAMQVGIKYPVAIEKSIWDKYINHDHERLWDVLWTFRLKASYEKKSLMRFCVSFANELIDLWAVCSPGDQMEPVVTIMLQ